MASTDERVKQIVAEQLGVDADQVTMISVLTPWTP